LEKGWIAQDRWDLFVVFLLEADSFLIGKPIEERYKDILTGIYEKKESIKVESQVAYRDGRTGMVRTEVMVNYLS
jgi:hypothetical protein